jgi:hypothetical protein
MLRRGLTLPRLATHLQLPRTHVLAPLRSTSWSPYVVTPTPAALICTSVAVRRLSTAPSGGEISNDLRSRSNCKDDSSSSSGSGGGGDNNNGVSVATLRAARDGPLRARLNNARAELEKLEELKARCDAAAQRFPDRRMRQLFVFLLVQAAVLFDWTYIHFDWNLVEPITYLLGYSATWIAILWYGLLQREFSYDGLRHMLRDQQQRKLYTQHKFDVAHYECLKREVATLEKVLRSLEPL